MGWQARVCLLIISLPSSPLGLVVDRGRFRQGIQDMLGSFLIGSEIGLQIIRAHKHLDHRKQKKKFDQNDLPERAAEDHATKPVTIETVYAP